MCGPSQTRSPNSRTQPSGTGVLRAVTEREVKQLWRLFKEIDRDQNGKVSPEEMMTIPQLEFNPLGKRVVTRAMTKRNSDNLSFKVPPHPRVRALWIGSGHDGWQRLTFVGRRAWAWVRVRALLHQRPRPVRRRTLRSRFRSSPRTRRTNRS